MTRRPAMLALAVAVLTFVSGVTAHADDARAESSRSYQEGLQMIQADRLAEAIAHFKRAIETNPGAAEPYAAMRRAAGLQGRTVGEVGLEAKLTRAVYEHLQHGELDDAEKIITSLFDARFTNPEVHLMLQTLHARRGRSAASAHAGQIFKGFMDVLLASGDGRTEKTALVVQGITEEYLLVGYVLRCRPKSQAVAFPPSGGVYDVLRIVCADGERSMFFDVTAWGPEPAWRLKTYGPAPTKPD